MKLVMFIDEKDKNDVPRLQLNQRYFAFQNDGQLVDIYSLSMNLVGTYCVERFSEVNEEEIPWVIAEAGKNDFPGQSVPKVFETMATEIGFSIEEAIKCAFPPDEVRYFVRLASLVHNETPPELEYEYEDDPKYDMGFWRTGIHVSPF